MQIMYVVCVVSPDTGKGKQSIYKRIHWIVMRVTSGKTGLSMNQKCFTFPSFIFAKVMVSICQQTLLLVPDTSMPYTMAYNEKPTVLTV
jgi:hypothetical protein